MNIVVVGAGISGLLLASKLYSLHPEKKITIIDQAPQCGGLLAGKYYPDHDLYFDLGTHIPRETGDEEIDAVMLSAIGKENLIHYPRGCGDYAGAFYNHKLQTNSHFPDIRQHGAFDDIAPTIRQYINEEDTVYEPKRDSPFPQESYRKFGTVYTDRVLKDILPSIYQRPIEDLAWFAAELPGLSRVIVDDQREWELNSQNERYRATIAFPEQRELPQDYISPKRSFYSRKNGSKALINGLHDNLVRQGVEFILSSHIESCDLDGNYLIYEGKNKNKVRLDFHQLVIATGIIGAAHILKIPLQNFGFDRPMSHRIINIVVDQKIDTDLFYFYGLSNDCDFYRVTNYAGILNDSNDKRLSIEVLGERAESDKELVELILRQLYQVNFLNSVRVSFSDVIKLPSGFPVPTVKNLCAMNSLREKIEHITHGKNVVITGVGSAKGLFFQSEIIEHGLRFIG